MSETVNKNLGHVTAYAYAKSKGYTGTEEEFAELMASYGTVAQAAADSARAAAQAKMDAEAALETSAEEAERSIDDKALTVIQDIETAGAEQTAGIRQAGENQVNAVETAGSEQTAAVEQKGEQVRQSIPSDYTELSEDVGVLKSALNDRTYKSFAEYETKNGYIASGKWMYTGFTSYGHKIIPVSSGETVIVTATNGQVAFLKTYAPVDNETADFSVAEGYASVIGVSNTTKTFTVPPDAVYMYFLTKANNSERPYSSVIINGLDITKTMKEEIASLELRAQTLETGVNELKTVAYYKLISEYEQYNGFLNGNTGKWTYTQYANYRHICIPVHANDILQFVTGNVRTTVAMLKTYSTPIDGEMADFSEVTGFTLPISIQANKTENIIIPSDATYLYMFVLNNNNSIVPRQVNINGVDITKTIPQEIINLKERANTLENVTGEIPAIRQTLGMKKASTYGTPRGLLSETFEWSNCTDGAIYEFRNLQLPVTAGQKLKIVANVSNALSHLIFLKEYSAPVDGTTASVSEIEGYTTWKSITKGNVYEYIIPSDCTYIYVSTMNNGVDVMPQAISLDRVRVDLDIFGNLVLLHNEWDTDVNWCAMGDSIVGGYYSTVEGGSPVSRYDLSVVWPKKVSELNHWTLTNLGIGGGGYYQDGSGGGPRGYILARQTDYSGFDLVTIAYGTNDWGNNVSLGSMDDDPTAETISAFIPAMRATLEAIIESNPLCKIIVILPFNRKQGTASESDNWALGYEQTNTGTLESFCQKMIEVCNYYGIQYIDAAHSSIINRKNLPEVLLDGIHPSIAGHYAIAHEMAKKITY